MQDTAPPAAYWPARHIRQSVLLKLSSSCLPTGHTTQDVGRVRPPAELVATLPAGQSVQVCSPPRATTFVTPTPYLFSVEQSTQEPGLPLTTFSPRMPAGQTHGVLASLSWSNCGSMHAAQSVRRVSPFAAMASWSGEHCTHGVEGSLSVSACPGAQSVHPPVPVLLCGLYWPLAQSAQGV